MGTPCRCLELGEWVGPLLLRSREPDPSLKLADDSGNATFLGPSRAPLFPWHRLGSPHPFTRGLSAFDHPQALHVLGAHSPSWTPTSCACSSLHLHMPHLPEDHLPFPTTLHLHNLRPFIHCLLLLCPSHSRSTLRTEGPRARYSSPPACTPLSCPAPGTAISDGLELGGQERHAKTSTRCGPTCEKPHPPHKSRLLLGATGSAPPTERRPTPFLRAPCPLGLLPLWQNGGLGCLSPHLAPLSGLGGREESTPPLWLFSSQIIYV